MEHVRVLTLQQLSDILVAMRTTVDLAKQSGFNDAESMFLQLVTEEACMNAFENYGQGFEFRCNINHTFFEILLTQAGGCLFDMELNNDSDVNTGLRGRGLQLICQLMDDVRVDKLGEAIVFSMKKHLPSRVDEGDGGERRP